MSRSECDVKNEMTESLNIILKFIKPYNGNRETLNAFLNNCQNAIDLASSNQQSVVLKYIISQLEGRAELACSIKEFTSWPTLKEFLKSQFGERKHYAHLLTDLQECKQNQNETVSQYALRVESCLSQLLTEVNMSCPRTAELIGRLSAMEDLALQSFILGLNPKISLVVRCQNPNSLNEAINIAISEEKLVHFINKRNPSGNNLNQLRSGKPTNSQNHFNKFSHQGTPNFSKFTNNKFSSIVCRYCKTPGHTIDRCKKREYNNNRFKFQPSRPINYMNYNQDNANVVTEGHDEIDLN